MQTNKASLPVASVQGKVDHPIMSKNRCRAGCDGYGGTPMAAGGIIYNYKIGDSYMGVAGDHIESGVGLKNLVEKENSALQASACIGNKAKIISNDAKGEEGHVTGKHGGIDHVMVYFDEETLELMTTGNKVPIKACGQGLKLTDHGEIQLMNIGPTLFEGLGIVEEGQGTKILVVTCVPAYLTGSGLGSMTTMLGDYDIMTQDAQANKEFGINELHFGDLIMIQDYDNHNGPHYRRGMVSVDAVVYADPYTSRHGPGLAVTISNRCGSIEPILDPNVNITNYLHIK